MVIIWFLDCPVAKYLAKPDSKLYNRIIKQLKHPEESIIKLELH